ncbi:ArnT family glycosyltransferase [Paenibacillus sp. y28]|uniref:ArnT family glycosyltransferase n=1 Tax=Paenibacillus sp. y28 TaxID=3129110 RepID=UPI003016B15F
MRIEADIRAGAAKSGHKSGRKLTYRIVVSAGAVFFALLLWFAAQNTGGFLLSGLGWQKASLLLGGSALVLVLAAAAAERMNRIVYLGLLLALAAALRYVWVVSMDTPPVSDFLDMHQAALQAAAGDYSFGTNAYFSRWIYQLGFAMAQAVMVKWFGPSLLALKLWNAALSTGTVLLVYGIGRTVLNEAAGRAAALCLAIYVPNIIMCSVLTNQHLSTFLFAAGLYAVLHWRLADWYSWALIGLLFGLGNIVRPLGGFYLAGLAVYAVVFLLLPWARRGRVLVLLRLAGVIVIYMLVQQFVSWAFIAGGITPYKLSNPEPYWKLVAGLNAETTGGWSWEDEQEVLRYPLGEARSEAELAIIRERMADKEALLELLGRKFVLMWGGEDAAPVWSLWGMEEPGLKMRLIALERVMYTLMAAFGLLGLLACLYRGAEEKGQALLILLLLGYALLHLAIEIQTRYRFDVMPLLLIPGAYGLSLAADGIKRLIRRRRET